jgi:hypothetical protein
VVVVRRRALTRAAAVEPKPRQATEDGIEVLAN